MREGEENRTDLLAPRLRAWGAACAFALGIALAGRAGASADPPGAGAWAVAGVGVLLGALSVRRRGAGWARGVRWVGLAIAAALFGAAWGAHRLHERPRDDLARLLAGAEPGVPLRVEGVVLAPPRQRPPRPGSLDVFLHARSEPAFPLRVERLLPDGGEPVRASGRLTVAVPGIAAGAVRPGDRITVLGAWSPPPPTLNPGEEARAARNAQQRRVGSLRTTDPSLLRPAVRDLGPLDRAERRVRRLVADLRARALAAVGGGDADEASDDPSRAFLLALLLGEHEHGVAETRSAFQRVGVAHLLAISGFHLTALVLVGVGAARLFGDRGWLEPALAAALVVLYLAVLPAEAPIVRAGALLLALLAAEAFGRRYDRLTILGWITLALLVWRPADAGSLGLRLSVGITALLLWTAEARPEFVFGPPRVLGSPWIGPGLLARAARALRSFFMANLACWLVAAPLIARQTGAFSPLGAPATALLTGPLTLVLVAGHAGAILSSLLPEAAPAVSAALAALCRPVLALVHAVDALPFAQLSLGRVSLAWTVFATGAGVALVALGPRRRVLAWSLAGLAVLWGVAEARLRPALAPGVLLRVDMLAVGDGSALLVRSGEEALLWDCGSLTPGVGLHTVPRAAHALGAPTPTALLSHPNIDHYAGLPDAAPALGVRRLLASPALFAAAEAAPDGPEALLLRLLAAQGVTAEALAAGDRLRLGHAAIEVLWPPGDLAAAAGERRALSANDLSLVLLARVPTPAGERSLLLTGDLGPEAIRRLRERRPGLRADVLELPHHGSFNAEAARWLAELDPAVVLQSTGPRRLGDERWAPFAAGRAWLITAAHGAAFAEIRRDGSVRRGAFRAAPATGSP